MLPSNKRNRTHAAAGAVLAGLLLATTACGSDDAVRDSAAPAVPDDLECFSGSISGAGSSAQENAMTTWIAGYQSACDDARVYYDSIGSGGGRNQFIDGAVTFAGTDAAVGPEENEDARARCDGSDTINLPAYVVAIAVVFNLEGIDSLDLRPDTIARIFDQEITRWDDPEIAETNPDVELPDLEITPVNRADDSGTTENFTRYLEEAASEAWPHEADGQWPITPRESAQGNSGIADTVKRAEGSIGYVEMSHVHDMSTVAVGVGGTFVEISPEAAAQVVADSPRSEDASGEYDLALDLDYGTTAEGAYPLVLVSYESVCLDYPDDKEAERLKGFLRYLVSEEGQQAVSEETGSTPVNDTLREQLLASIDAVS
ncbi:phosphate ABC transporter substrate-binding protein PstS [Nocardiopsis lambiniae]|uniref:Phosphate-binding protein n=1 Tax=Nocardiopsis lambiniae TaxID=3075539 RepID=A0ABU2MDF6_9ACTN|nr:phosphate ABC transporter substrate-binding protein PstS [Nocardiopsis sp. DSM 44743]MDT0330155.1 phosphate ABC transporter substrate-binding protein PstS [Nocardiopsis sp. DSM 44743]